MIKLKVKDKEYKLKFGYKSFKNSGILKEVVDMQKHLRGTDNDKEEEKSETDNLEAISDVFELNSKLVLAALQKNHEEFRADYKNPDSINECVDKVDDLLDDYMEEPDSMSVMTLFEKLANELFDNGFLSEKSEKLEAALEATDATIVPTDHRPTEN